MSSTTQHNPNIVEGPFPPVGGGALEDVRPFNDLKWTCEP